MWDREAPRLLSHERANSAEVPSAGKDLPMLPRLRFPAPWAVAGLATVLVVLAGFALWGALTTNRDATDVTWTTATSTAFTDARYAVGQE